MTMLQLLIIMNYSRRIIGFLRVNCIFVTFFDIGPDPPKTENFVTRPDPWVDPTRVQLWMTLFFVNRCLTNSTHMR